MGADAKTRKFFLVQWDRSDVNLRLMGQIIHKFGSDYRASDVNLCATRAIRCKKLDLRLTLGRHT